MSASISWETAMRTLLGTVLGVIAVGVLLIAYGLLSPRASATAPAWNPMPAATDSRGNTYRPMAAPQLLLRCEPGQRALVWQGAGAAEAECADASFIDRYGSMRTPITYQTGALRPSSIYESYPVPRRTTPARVERSSGRDWKQTALVIGGTTAAGAGLGGIFGGKKGALIGAAIGGGASSIYEAQKH